MLQDAQSAQTLLKTNSNASPPIQCNGWQDFWNNPGTCVGWTLSGVISEMLVYTASWILAVAGIIFNWVLNVTVLQFGSLMNCGLNAIQSGAPCTTAAANAPINGINTAWTAFRDISNIVIIGMFTFIAIMTILNGSGNYGAKKMISKVLIVAVLINFSLLFTKIIIDVSNFMAVQIYSAASVSNPDLNTSTANNLPTNADTSQLLQNGNQQAGVAGAFMRYGGLSSFGDTYSAIKGMAQNTQSGLLALLFGVVVAVLYLAAAVILLYGSFLLISRAILMIFLMITAALAFASYLLPSDWRSTYGWSTWWSALLKNAIFAPLLVMFLWVTLLIAQAFKVQQGTLGDLVKNPQSSNDINALLGYFIVIGLLFIAFRVSSSFATQIGGFNLAQASLSAPLAALNRYGVSPLLQNWRGRRNLEKAEREGERARDEREKALNTGNFRPLINSLRRQEKYQNRAKSSYDVLNTSAGKVVGGALGVPKVLMAENKSSFATSTEASAKAAADKAAKLATLTDDEKKKIRDEAYDSKMLQKDHDKETLRRQDEAQRKQLEVMKKSADQQASVFEQQKQTMEKQLQSEEKAQTDLRNKHEGILKSIAEEIGKNQPGTSGHDELQKRYDAAKANRDAEMAKQDDKIKSVHQAIQAPLADLQKKIDEIHAPVKALETESKITQKKLDTFEEDFKKEAETVADTAVTQASVDTHRTAENLSAALTQPRWQQVLGIKPSEKNISAKQARDAFKKKTANKRMEELAKFLAEQTKENGEDKK
jgi:hypothetical protein